MIEELTGGDTVKDQGAHTPLIIAEDENVGIFYNRPEAVWCQQRSAPILLDCAGRWAWSFCFSCNSFVWTSSQSILYSEILVDQYRHRPVDLHILVYSYRTLVRKWSLCHHEAPVEACIYGIGAARCNRDLCIGEIQVPYRNSTFSAMMSL